MRAGDVDTAVLLTSEVVTNAAEHADGPAVLEARIRRTGDHQPQERTLRVAVTDRSPQVPTPRRTTTRSADAPDGRGLLLVSELADRWGWDPLRSGTRGKTVWFELDVA